MERYFVTEWLGMYARMPLFWYFFALMTASLFARRRLLYLLRGVHICLARFLFCGFFLIVCAGALSYNIYALIRMFEYCLCMLVNGGDVSDASLNVSAEDRTALVPCLQALWRIYDC